jgi:hypothetical protein
MITPIPITDLTQHPPRGFRVRLGGLVILARMLDKGRATLAGKNGDYEYLTSIDEQLVRFLESGGIRVTSQQSTFVYPNVDC